MFLKNAKPVDITFLQQEQIQHSKRCELKKENAICGKEATLQENHSNATMFHTNVERF